MSGEEVSCGRKGQQRRTGTSSCVGPIPRELIDPEGELANGLGTAPQRQTTRMHPDYSERREISMRCTPSTVRAHLRIPGRLSDRFA